jgi:hypothetical protein
VGGILIDRTFANRRADLFHASLPGHADLDYTQICTWPLGTTRGSMKQRRLSQRQRQMLRKAEQSPIQVTSGAQTDYQRRSMFRSARALRESGLVEIYRGPSPGSGDARRRGPIMLALTTKGRLVLASFRRQIESGHSIRWAAFPHELPELHSEESFVPGV